MIMNTATGLHAAEIVPLQPKDVLSFEMKVMQTIWGRSRPGRAKEIFFTLLCKGHMIALTLVPPGHRAGHQPLRDDCRLPRRPRRVPARPAPALHGGMGCHGPPIPILHDRVHPDPALRRHHSRRPHPLDRHRQRGPPGWRRGPLPLPPRHPTAGIRASTGIPGVRPIPATVPPHQLRGQQPPNYGHPPP